MVTLVCLAALLGGCGDSPPANNASPVSPTSPLPEFVSIQLFGPAEWEDRFAESNTKEHYQAIVSYRCAKDEVLVAYSRNYKRGKSEDANGGGLQDNGFPIPVGERSTIFFTTSGVSQYAMTRPYSIDLVNGTNVAQPGMPVSLEVIPAAIIKLKFAKGIEPKHTSFTVETMEGHILYDVLLHDEWRLPYMVPAGEEVRVRKHRPETSEPFEIVVGPFNHGTTNEVLVDPAGNNGN